MVTNDELGIITVGDGRGFVVEAEYGYRFIVTSAHCLPFFPPCASFSFREERTYPSLVGRLGNAPTVWAECLFADPIGDIAVLGSPDDQTASKLADEYADLLAPVEPFPIFAGAPPNEAWLFSLDQRWFKCKISEQIQPDSLIWIPESQEPIRGGMSGSPIRADDGSVFAVICAGRVQTDGTAGTEGGPNPSLSGNLPGWLWRQLSSSAELRG